LFWTCLLFVFKQLSQWRKKEKPQNPMTYCDQSE
jgi:hypothetical protein